MVESYGCWSGAGTVTVSRRNLKFEKLILNFKLVYYFSNLNWFIVIFRRIMSYRETQHLVFFSTSDDDMCYLNDSNPC